MAVAVTTAADPHAQAGAPPGPPVHPAAAALLLAVDNLWNLADWTVLSWFLTIPASFLTVSIPTLVIQRKLRGQRWGTALFFAVLLGAVAAVPTSVTGTPVGMALLAWTGISRWLGWRGHPPAASRSP